jgi:hypothetical protein
VTWRDHIHTRLNGVHLLCARSHNQSASWLVLRIERARVRSLARWPPVRAGLASSSFFSSGSAKGPCHPWCNHVIYSLIYACHYKTRLLVLVVLLLLTGLYLHFVSKRIDMNGQLTWKRSNSWREHDLIWELALWHEHAIIWRSIPITCFTFAESTRSGAMF